MPRTISHVPMYKYPVMGSAGGGSSRILGANFDGTNDYLIRNSDLTGNADSKVGLIAFRIRMNGGDGVTQNLYYGEDGHIQVQRQIDNRIYITLRDSFSSVAIDLRTSAQIIADGQYHNLIFSIDTANAAGCLAYLDDVDVTDLVTRVDAIIDYTVSNHYIGSVLGFGLINADLNFYYANYAETLDISIEANRRLFFDSQGNAVLNPSGDGSEATGTAPIIYFAGDYSSFEINNGTGGGFTVTGALARPSS